MNSLSAEEQDDVLRMVGMLCAKQGWGSYARRMQAIRERITAEQHAPIPPLPAGSILGDNFKPCRHCDTPRICAEFDSCGRGK